LLGKNQPPIALKYSAKNFPQKKRAVDRILTTETVADLDNIALSQGSGEKAPIVAFFDPNSHGQEA